MSDGFLKEVAMPPKAAKQHAERAVPVGTNFLLGRAKSCQWQVFVRRRPPKQGELRTDVSKATMFQGDGEALRPRFKALSEIVLEILPATRAEPGFSHKTAAKRL